MTVSVEALRGCHLRERMHLNGGPEWFGYVMQCDEHPRLSRVDRCYRKDRSTKSTWAVDGEEVESLDVAAERLAMDPTLDFPELALLALVSDEFQDMRFRGITAHLVGLSRKGVIEFETGRCRLTALGRRMLGRRP